MLQVRCLQPPINSKHWETFSNISLSEALKNACFPKTQQQRALLACTGPWLCWGRRLGLPTYRSRPGVIACPLGLVSQHYITHKSKGRNDLASTHISSPRLLFELILPQNRASHAENPLPSGCCSFGGKLH